MNDVTCIIQARAGSSRLPGKVLADVDGVPMLAFMLDRLAPLKVIAGVEVVVATSDQPADEAVADVCRESGTPVVRGPEQDVLARCHQAARVHPASTIVRLTGDCPLMDPAVVTDVLSTHRAAGAAYTSNTLLRTFPDGLDVEVMTRSALDDAARDAAAAGDREHVTPFLYRHPGRFRLAQHLGPTQAGDERWTIDTSDDLRWLEETVKSLDDPRSATWEAILSTIGRQPSDECLRLVPSSAHQTGGEFVRTWVVQVGTEARGKVDVTARDDGRATVSWSLDGIEEASVRSALAARLAADRQVDLIDDAEAGHWEVTR